MAASSCNRCGNSYAECECSSVSQSNPVKQHAVRKETYVRLHGYYIKSLSEQADGDVYTKAAAYAFGIPEKEVTVADRQLAKDVGFIYRYGRGVTDGVTDDSIRRHAEKTKR